MRTLLFFLFQCSLFRLWLFLHVERGGLLGQGYAERGGVIRAVGWVVLDDVDHDDGKGGERYERHGDPGSPLAVSTDARGSLLLFRTETAVLWAGEQTWFR